MGRIKKKHEAGAATQYITRKHACKRLQLSLANFRRICILKGIYPHEPAHKKKVNKGSTANRTFYFLKDIQFLAHEPVISKFREHKTYIKKLKKATAKDEKSRAAYLRENKPTYKIDHIVRERYPTFTGAIQDLDDALCMCFLFSNLPKSHSIHSETVQLCRRLTVEFMHYVIEAKALRKVFISIKGIYFQSEIMGQPVTWITPHNFSHHHPEDVDFKVMSTFTEFFRNMLGFVLFKLYNDINLHYPPRISITSTAESEKDDEKRDDGDLKDLPKFCMDNEVHSERVTSLNTPLARTEIDDQSTAIQDEEVALLAGNTESIAKQKEEDEALKKFQNLFSNCKFFLGREVPKETLVFVIRSFGGVVSWDKTAGLGSTYSEDNEKITHQIVDRPNPNMKFITRRYLQPQWVFDCINARMLLPVTGYLPGDMLPPHLSPFVDDSEGYIPPEQERLRALQRGEDPGLNNQDSDYSEEEEVVEDTEQDDEGDNEEEVEDSEDEKIVEKQKKLAAITVKTGKKDFDRKAQPDQIAAEEKRLAVMMIPKKKLHLYKKIKYGERRKNRQKQELAEKRKAIDKEKKKTSKKMKTA
uniref:pescadillo homolog n=1 Tax=Styela clava TaxID=7725 RepID=UPI00193A8700|nr:pescadillo homolog [Styela clava]